MNPAEPTPPRPLWWRLLPLWGVLLLLATTPFSQLPRDLWTDEAFTASYTTYSTVGLVLEDVRKNEETPPLYFLLIWLWSRVAGSGEVALRLPSLIGAMLAVAILVALMQRWRSDAEALVAGAAMALSPLVAHFTVEARVYSLLMLMTVGGIAAFEYVYRHPHNRLALAGYTLMAAILFLTSYFGIAILAAHNLIWIVRVLRHRAHWRQDLLPWVIVQVGIGVLVLPWLPALLYQVEVASATTFARDVSAGWFFMLALSLAAYTESSVTMFSIWLFAFFWSIMIYGLLRSLDRRGDEGLVLRAFGVPLLMMGGVVLLLQASSVRYLMVLTPGIAIATAAGWNALRQRFPHTGAMLAGGLIGVLLLYRLPGIVAPPPIEQAWGKLSARVAQQANPLHDTVIFQPPGELRSFTYYYHGPSLRLLGAQNYDEFYDVQGHDFRTTWNPNELEAIIGANRETRRVWVFFKPFIFQPEPFRLPYRLTGHWKSAGELELFRYEIAPGEINGER
ncbi:MAG: hypothetical protein HC884_18040 [Chloroflexaceae bacterium]|nr:hypothetical protein [Chloroflexaceae bacterium]